MADTTIEPAVGAMDAAFVAAGLMEEWFLAPSAATLALTGTTVEYSGVDWPLAPLVGSLSIAGKTVVYTGVDWPLAPSVGSLAFTFIAPSVYQLLVAAIAAGKLNGFRTAAVTSEQWIRNGKCRVYGVYPEVASTSGTIKLRNTGGAGGLTPTITCPIATLGAGKTFGPAGIEFPDGLSVQLSDATDLSLVVWEAI